MTLLGLLGGISCTAQTVPASEDAAQTEWTLYGSESGDSYFHSFKGPHHLADLQVQHVVLRGPARPRDIVLTGGIDFKVFHKGTLKYRLQGKEAILPYPYQHIDFIGLVQLTQGESELEMDQMHFDPRAKMAFQTAGFIQIKQKNKLLEGQGARISLDLEAWEIDAVKGVLELEE